MLTLDERLYQNYVNIIFDSKYGYIEKRVKQSTKYCTQKNHHGHICLHLHWLYQWWKQWW
jgi:hypothetical protein